MDVIFFWTVEIPQVPLCRYIHTHMYTRFNEKRVFVSLSSRSSSLHSQESRQLKEGNCTPGKIRVALTFNFFSFVRARLEVEK